MKFNKIIGMCLCLWIINFAFSISLKTCDDDQDDCEISTTQSCEIIIPQDIFDLSGNLTILKPEEIILSEDEDIRDSRKYKNQNLYKLRLVDRAFRDAMTSYIIRHEKSFITLTPKKYFRFQTSLRNSSSLYQPLDCMSLTTQVWIRGDWNLDPDNLQLEEISKSMIHLKELDIMTNKKTKQRQDSNNLIFATLIKKMQSLENFSIKNSVTSASAKIFCQSIILLSNLTKLSISGIAEVTCISDICRIIQFLPKLKFLSLPCNGVGDEGAQIIADNLCHIPNIESIYLRIGLGINSLNSHLNYMTDEGAISLANKIVDCSKLTYLNLDYNCINQDGLNALNKALNTLNFKSYNNFKLSIKNQNLYKNYTSSL
ncbi:MAG: hypothetical protein ACRYGR_03015 [Janthinobacterium lividum]